MWSHSTNIAAQDFKLVRGLLPGNSQIRQHKGLCDPCQNKFLQDNWILRLILRRSWNLADHSRLVSLLDLKTQYYILNKVKNDVTDHTCWELDWTSVPSRYNNCAAKRSSHISLIAIKVCSWQIFKVINIIHKSSFAKICLLCWSVIAI